MLVGLGATLSDLVYGLIAYWGVGIVLISSISTVAHSARWEYLHLASVSSSSRDISSTSEDDSPAPPHRLKSAYSVKKVSGAFALTLSNPFIILLFLPLYARLEFVRAVSSNSSSSL